METKKKFIVCIYLSKDKFLTLNVTEWSINYCAFLVFDGCLVNDLINCTLDIDCGKFGVLVIISHGSSLTCSTSSGYTLDGFFHLSTASLQQ